ncbi:hypothetical protein DYH09_08765 [bacterium CPR1]|nr:hypothetical protein [bacterium CPR1]
MMLIMALMVSVILLLVGIAFMSSKVLQYRGAYRACESAQALALARAGLEDARVKLERDHSFPPRGTPDQDWFSYTERVTDLGSNVEIGSYTVTIDISMRNPPYEIYRITSIGQAGPMVDPVARRKLYAELDVAPKRRDDPTQDNLELFNYIQRLDLGNL